VKKNVSTYVSKPFIGLIIPIIYFLVLISFNRNSPLSLPINLVLYFCEYIYAIFGEYAGVFSVYSIFFSLTLIVIFLNGLFCAYKKIDWKLPTIMSILILVIFTHFANTELYSTFTKFASTEFAYSVFNFFTFDKVVILGSFLVTIVLLTHITGNFIGKRLIK